MGKSDGVYAWRTEDAAAIFGLLMAYLQEMGRDILPLTCNVNHLLRTGLEAAQNGDPCLIIWRDGKPVGFTYWTGPPAGLVLKERIITAMGTYIDPEYRGKKLSTELRDAAIAIANSEGYDRVNGSAFDKRGWETLTKQGWSTDGLYMTRRIFT